MAFVDEDQLAQSFMNAYSNLMDQNRDLLPLYLSKDAVIDWFGRTVRGLDNIVGYFKYEIPKTIHVFSSVELSGPVQHRKKNIFIPNLNINGNGKVQNGDVPSTSAADACNGASKINDIFKNLTLGSPSVTNKTPSSSELVTPPFSCPIYLPELGQGDCLMESPSTYPYKFVEARGGVELSRIKVAGHCSLKNAKEYMAGRKWERSFKLHVTYRASGEDVLFPDLRNTMTREFQICQIIYQDNTRCRRNLALEFESL